jgi:hypothetical protein
VTNPKPQWRPPKGHPKWGGRVKGTPNRMTTFLKDAAIEAAMRLGSDRKGKDELVGYLMFAAMEEPAAYLSLLGRILPLQAKMRISGAVQLVDATMTPKQAIEAWSNAINADAQQLIEAKKVEVEEADAA